MATHAHVDVLCVCLIVSQGAPAVTAGPNVGAPAATMTIPPAFQAGTPFGSNVGGTDPTFWAYDPTARYDSWLTVGVVDGHSDGKLSSIGTIHARAAVVHALVAISDAGRKVKQLV